MPATPFLKAGCAGGSGSRSSAGGRRHSREDSRSERLSVEMGVVTGDQTCRSSKGVVLMQRNPRSLPRGRALIHWGSIFAGAVWALAVTVLLSTLFLALGYASEVDAIKNNIEWFLAGSAMIGLFVGGFLAGWLPGVRGWGPGVINGMTVWGIILTISLLIGIPSVLGGAAALLDNVGGLSRVTGSGGQSLAAGNGVDTGLWAGFFTALIGFVLAAIGGALGGASPRNVDMYETFDTADRNRDDRSVNVAEYEDDDVTTRPNR
jgi:putative membrane protein (TIGR04086 family)